MGEAHLGVPVDVWQGIKSAYPASTLPRLRESLSRLSFDKNVPGINLVIKQRLEAIFDFIDDIARIDDPSKLKDRNLFLIYRNAHIINNLCKISPKAAEIIKSDATEMISALDSFIRQHINPYLDTQSQQSIQNHLGVSVNSSFRTKANAAGPSKQNLLPLLLLGNSAPVDSMISFDTHIQCMVEPNAVEPQQIVKSLQEKREGLFALDPDMRAILDSFVMNNVLDAFSEKLPREFYIKISCARGNSNRIEFKLPNGEDVPELEAVKAELNQDMDLLLRERMIPIFSEQPSTTDKLFYLVRVHRIARNIVSPRPEDN